MEQDSCTSYYSRVQPTKPTVLDDKPNIKDKIVEEEEEETLKFVPAEAESDKVVKETKLKKKEKKQERRSTPYYYSNDCMCRDGF